MNENFAIDFVSELRDKIEQELVGYYLDERIFPRVVLHPPLNTSIVLEKQHGFSGKLGLVEPKIPVKQETHVLLDYLSGTLDVWDEGIDAGHSLRELNARLGDGTQVERFMMVGDNPASSGYRVTKDGETVYLDDLAKRIIKPICDAPGSVA
jgi:hypothetical protein